MKITTILTLALLVFITIPVNVFAHCPLCTAGAGILAVAAASLGISTASVGVLIGAFSLALGMWVANSIKKKHIKYQNIIVSLGIFFATVVPIMPFIREYRGIYIPFWGEYGTSYALNIYLFGVFIGAVILFSAPHISKLFTRICKGRTFPFQTMVITFLFLFLGAVFLQIIF